MWLTIVWRRSGIAILIYLILSFWLTSYGFNKPHSLSNAPYAGWAFFYAAIATVLHALLLFLGRNSTPEENTAEQPEANELAEPAEEVQKDTIWSHSFFYIPVVFWPLILGGLCAYFLTRSDPKKEIYESESSAKTEIKKPTRTVHFFNLSADTLKYSVFDPETEIVKGQVSPNKFRSTIIEEGLYFMGASGKKDNIINAVPDIKFVNDTSKYIKLQGATPAKNDYDDAWFIMDTTHNMALVEVTGICNAQVSRAAIEKKDWQKLLIETYNGRELIEPLSKKNPEQGQFTVLHPGEKFPQQLNQGERVFVLFAFPTDQELDNKYILKKILLRCPETIK